MFSFSVIFMVCDFNLCFSNPDQSKHLETATMKLYDLWIDFVNLRCEDYSENSRIPTMVNEFGLQQFINILPRWFLFHYITHQFSFLTSIP